MTEQQARLKIVAWATSQLGAVRGDAKHKKIIDTYNEYLPHPRGYKMTYTADWCASFASAAFIASGFAHIIPVECSCGEQVREFEKMGLWVENDAYKPSAGDLIYYDWDDSGRGDNTGAPDHVGIVIDVNGLRICVVEGNKGKKSEVATRTIKVGDRYIRGYGIPDYKSLVTQELCTVNLPVLKRGSKGEAVKTLQRLLNQLYAELYDERYELRVDGSFGSITESAVKDVQSINHLPLTGVVNAEFWEKLINKTFAN